MNKRLLFILPLLPLLLLSLSSFGQLQKGNKILGGTINYSTSTNASNDTGVAGEASFKSKNFTNNPFLGVFVSDQTVVGVIFDIKSNLYENTSPSGPNFKFKDNHFGFGPFVRRYFPVKEWVSIYGQAELLYGFGNRNQTYEPPNSDMNYKENTQSVNISASLGIAFFPLNWMSIDLAINPLVYSHQLTRNEVGNRLDSNTNTFNFNLSTESFGIGAHFFFNKK